MSMTSREFARVWDELGDSRKHMTQLEHTLYEMCSEQIDPETAGGLIKSHLEGILESLGERMPEDDGDMLRKQARESA